MRYFEADFVVVGSGAGGACVARELTKTGKNVLILEKGKYHKRVGNHLSALFYTDRMSFYFTKEGLNIVRGITVGGSTILYCGCSADPPDWLEKKYGINLKPYAEEIKKELKVRPLPESLWGDGSTRIMQAAQRLGFKWEAIPKFMNPERSKKGFRCSSSCMVGCSCGAKWTAREYIDECVSKGARLVTKAEVHSLIIKNGKCTGVRGMIGRDGFEARGKVILCAGGIGTAMILRNSGIRGAGDGFSIDPTVIVYGVLKSGSGNFKDPPMTVGSYEFEKDGFMLSTLTDTWMTFPIQLFLKKKSMVFKAFQKRKILGIMVKTKDEIAGSIDIEGNISKPLTDNDMRRMNMGSAISKMILIEAGCRPDSIFLSPVRGTHPQATARIGEVLDEWGKVKGVDDLYVSDASWIPEALDRPMVLTIMSFSKRLAEKLIKG